MQQATALSGLSIFIAAIDEHGYQNEQLTSVHDHEAKSIEINEAIRGKCRVFLICIF